MNKIFLLLLGVWFISMLSCSKKDAHTAADTHSQINSDTTKSIISKDTIFNIVESVNTEQQAKSPKQAPNTPKNQPQTGETNKENKALDDQCQHAEKLIRATNVSFTDGALFSGKYEISYKITNTSNLITIKNVTFRVDYLDDADNIIGTDKHNFNRVFTPKAHIDTMLKSPKIKGTEKIRIVCISAECIK